jgi:hypothetical protein
MALIIKLFVDLCKRKDEKSGNRQQSTGHEHQKDALSQLAAK